MNPTPRGRLSSRTRVTSPIGSLRMSHHAGLLSVGVLLLPLAFAGFARDRAISPTPAAADIDANTFSIVAYDPERKEWGVAVASKYLAVGAAVPWAKAGVGAVATQAAVNVTFGPRGLELLEKGKSATEAVKELTEADEGRKVRQLGIVD